MSETHVLSSSETIAYSESLTEHTSTTPDSGVRGSESDVEKQWRRRSTPVFLEAATIAAQHLDDSFPPLWVDQLPSVHNHHGQRHLHEDEEDEDFNIDVASDVDDPKEIDDEDAAMILDLDNDHYDRHEKFVKRASLDPTDTGMTHTDGNSTIAGSSFLGGWINGEGNGSSHPVYSSSKPYQHSNHTNSNEDETTFMDLDDTTTAINPDSDLWLDSMDDPMLPAILLVEHDPLIQQELLLDEIKRSSSDGIMGFYNNLHSQNPDSSSSASSSHEQISLQELFRQRRAQLAASMQRSRESRKYFYKIDLKSHIQQRCNLAKVLTEIEKSSRVLANQFRVMQQQQPPLLETHAEEEGDEDEQQMLAELLSDLHPSDNSIHNDDPSSLLPPLVDDAPPDSNGTEGSVVPANKRR